MSENVCTACGGSGQQWSGVEYMGQHEIVGCDECWGTGFDDVLAGVDSLRALLAQREAEIEALRGKVGDAVSRSAWAAARDGARAAAGDAAWDAARDAAGARYSNWLVVRLESGY